MIGAVVLDFDGVILESTEIKTETFAALYAEQGPAIVAAVVRHHLDNLGISRFEKFAWISEHLLGRPLAAAEREALGRRFAELVRDRVLAAPFVPGAEEALTTLAARGLPLVIASGTPEDELRWIVARRGLAGLFRGVHGAPRGKPEILREVLAELALAPGEVLFVGDGTTDHDAARATGVAFLARDSPDLHAHWRELGVRVEPDLVRLPALVAAW